MIKETIKEQIENSIDSFKDDWIETTLTIIGVGGAGVAIFVIFFLLFKVNPLLLSGIILIPIVGYGMILSYNIIPEIIRKKKGQYIAREANKRRMSVDEYKRNFL